MYIHQFNRNIKLRIKLLAILKVWLLNCKVLEIVNKHPNIFKYLTKDIIKKEKFSRKKGSGKSSRNARLPQLQVDFRLQKYRVIRMAPNRVAGLLSLKERRICILKQRRSRLILLKSIIIESISGASRLRPTQQLPSNLETLKA